MHTYIDIEDEQGLHWLLERNVRGARLQRCGPSGLDVDRAVDPNLPKVFLLKSVAYTTNADRPSATNQKLMELLCRDEDHQLQDIKRWIVNGEEHPYNLFRGGPLASYQSGLRFWL
eukprot:g17789.t1